MAEPRLRVLVAAASKYGSTQEIAATIGGVLSENGFEVLVEEIESVTAIEGFDAFVLGSAVYMGHWLKPARELVEKHGDQLRLRPVWLFSSGPLGEPPVPRKETIDVQWVIEATAAHGHRVFTGRLDRKRLGFVDRAVAGAVHAPEGDFRDWEAVRAWAREIAHTLRSEVPTRTTP